MNASQSLLGEASLMRCGDVVLNSYNELKNVTGRKPNSITPSILSDEIVIGSAILFASPLSMNPSSFSEIMRCTIVISLCLYAQILPTFGLMSLVVTIMEPVGNAGAILPLLKYQISVRDKIAARMSSEINLNTRFIVILLSNKISFMCGLL